MILDQEEYDKEAKKLYKKIGRDKFILAAARCWREKEMIAWELDDHTSVWGGAGPDCPIGRLEAACIKKQNRRLTTMLTNLIKST
jgi:hypothetical protein